MKAPQVEPAQDVHDEPFIHVTLKGYLTGFVLSVILTAIPFWLVMAKKLPNSGIAAAVLLGLAAIQIVVHVIYFLHMNTKAENGWTFLALLFTVIMVAIVIVGSVWVMYHLDYNMMPGMMHNSTQQMLQHMREMP